MTLIAYVFTCAISGSSVSKFHRMNILIFPSILLSKKCVYVYTQIKENTKSAQNRAGRIGNINCC
jgi:hypothetical protein